MRIHIQNMKLQICKPEFRVFLFFLGFVLFNAPFLTIAEDLVSKGQSAALFISLFLSWGAIIFLLFLAAVGGNSWDSNGTTEESKEE